MRLLHDDNGCDGQQREYGSALSDPDAMARLLEERFGFDSFLPGQGEVIPGARAAWARARGLPHRRAENRSAISCRRSLFEGVTLVVSPLIALMKDQIDWLTRHGIAAARLDSSLERGGVARVGRALEQGTLKLLYVAPERFQNERFLQSLTRLRIALFAIDEAHCISEWGHNFRPEYLKLATIARNVGAERVLALTATATPAVVRDICGAFDIPTAAAIVTGFYRSNLELVIETTQPAERDARLLEHLRRRAPGPSIVYVTLQKTAERVAALSARRRPARERVPRRARAHGTQRHPGPVDELRSRHRRRDHRVRRGGSRSKRHHARTRRRRSDDGRVSAQEYARCSEGSYLLRDEPRT